MISLFKKRFFFSTTIVLVALLAVGGILFYLLPLKGSIPVLMYHFIGSAQEAKESGNFVTHATFDRQMRYLRMWGIRVISIETYEAIRHGKKQARGREVVITFDDGNVSFFESALPILRKYGFPATQFLVSQNIRTGHYGSIHLDKLQTYKADPLISWGAHTRTHPFLSELSDEQVKLEIEGSKKELEEDLNRPVHYLAYPFGNFDSRSIIAAEQAGYHLAFTTSPKKLNGMLVGKLNLTRVKISESSANPFVFWIKISGIYEFFKIWRQTRQFRADIPGQDSIKSV